MSFLDQIISRAKADKKTIILPESLELRTIQAAEKICGQDIANVIFIGNPDEIREKAKGYDISKVTIVDHLHAPELPGYIEQFTEMRKAKGMTLEKAAKTLQDPLHYACMMVKNGQADGMVAGAVHSTGDTLRPALQIIKTAPDAKVVSAFFVMVVPDCEYGKDGAFVFGDSGLVENPDANQLSEIAIASAKSFEQLVQGEPVVAMLSYSTKGSAKNPLVDKVIEATKLAQKKCPNLRLDGELQLDAALVDSVAKSKAPGSRVAGHANVLIFPDLNAGNIGYKLVQRLAKAEAYGPITQGLNRPVNDLSRGCSADDIVGVTAITCVQAQAKK